MVILEQCELFFRLRIQAILVDQVNLIFVDFNTSGVARVPSTRGQMPLHTKKNWSLKRKVDVF